jgi:hypothetical protein
MPLSPTPLRQWATAIVPLWLLAGVPYLDIPPWIGIE